MRRPTGRWADHRPPRLLPWAGLLLALAAAPLRADSPGGGGDLGPAPRVRSARVTILSTMLADTKGIGEWGFAALVEADGHRLLFDTGARPETVLANARELGVDLSGRHRRRPQPPPRRPHRRPADAPPRADEGATPRRCRAPTSARGIFLPRPGDDGREANETIALKAPYEATGRPLRGGRPRRREVVPGAWLTGPVPRKPPRAELERPGPGPDRRGPGRGHDPGGHVAGARHRAGPGGGHRLRPRRGRQYAGIRPGDGPRRPRSTRWWAACTCSRPTRRRWTGRRASSGRWALGHLLGAHCTGIEAVYALRPRLGLDRRTCVVGAVGAGFDLDGGIRPGTIAR